MAARVTFLVRVRVGSLFMQLVGYREVQDGLSLWDLETDTKLILAQGGGTNAPSSDHVPLCVVGASVSTASFHTNVQ